MNDELVFQKGKRKYLFCADLKGKELIETLIPHVINENKEYNVFTIEDEPDATLQLLLNNQKMGTYLYIAGKSEFVNQMKRFALDAGFSEHELQWKVCGPIIKNVMCISCHGMNEVHDELHIQCAHCALLLEVTDHYSPRLQAYLGYTPIK